MDIKRQRDGLNMVVYRMKMTLYETSQIKRYRQNFGIAHLSLHTTKILLDSQDKPQSQIFQNSVGERPWKFKTLTSKGVLNYEILAFS